MDYQRLLGVKESQPRFHPQKKNPEPMWRLGAAVSRYLQEDGQNDDGVAVYDFTTNLSRYATPVLFIAGSKSEVLGESLQQKQIMQYPSASLEVVSGAGHDVHWTQTGEVLTLVRGYLNAVKGGSQ
jgi:pimeloyl-ACP methyl ester carboxylesterase